jgi:hypothetical protein
MGSPEIREQLVSVLASAHAHHALGFDRLRDSVCNAEDVMSNERARACSLLPAGVEEEWPQSGRAVRWLAKGALTAAFVGAVTAAAVERHEDAGRVIATSAGVTTGATIGFAMVDARRRTSTYGSLRRDLLLISGAAIGGALGGLATYALADRPGGRAPATAVALTPLYFSLVVSLDADELSTRQ